MKPDFCILCDSKDLNLFYQDYTKNHRSDYYRCETCKLIFAPAWYRPAPREEAERYDEHENDPDDEQYRTFLRRMLEPMDGRLSSQSKGLDFGSGPGPTLHLMFEERGHRMKIYDPFYADDPTVFDETYDFITATEVVEHLHDPQTELDRLWNCLRPNGYLGIMTKLARDKEAFANWHYVRDITHVTFFSRDTFSWLADKWKAELSFVRDDVIILKKP